MLTEGFEDKLNQLLNDPDSMAQILSLAQSFGSSTSPEAPPPQNAPDESLLTGLMQLMQQTRQTDGRQEALLLALRPYLAPERQSWLDRAMELARISHLAGVALRSYGGLLGKGEPHV